MLEGVTDVGGCGGCLGGLTENQRFPLSLYSFENMGFFIVANIIDQRKPQRSEADVLRSIWSVTVTSFEAAAMDHIFVLAYKRGLILDFPVYDGAMWNVPDGLIWRAL